MLFFSYLHGKLLIVVISAAAIKSKYHQNSETRKLQSSSTLNAQIRRPLSTQSNNCAELFSDKAILESRCRPACFIIERTTAEDREFMICGSPYIWLSTLFGRVIVIVELSTTRIILHRTQLPTCGHFDGNLTAFDVRLRATRRRVLWL